MGFFSSLFCKHEWDGAWQHNGHECSLCGHIEPHDWVAIEYAPVNENPETQAQVPDWGDAGRAEVRTTTLSRVYRCTVCGATRMR